MLPGDLVAFSDKLQAMRIQIRTKKLVNGRWQDDSCKSDEMFLFIQELGNSESIHMSYVGLTQADVTDADRPWPAGNKWCILLGGSGIFSNCVTIMKTLVKPEQAETVHVGACIEELRRVEDTLVYHPKTLHESDCDSES